MPTNLAGIRREGGVGGREGGREGGGEAAAEDRRVGEPLLDGHGRGQGHRHDDLNSDANDLQQAEVQLQAR